MASSKPTDFKSEQVELADLAKALGHPGRLEILNILADRACICGDIVERMPLSQATVSQHLKELKRAGLILGEIEGPRICYCLDGPAVAEAGRRFAGLFENLACNACEGETCEES